MMFFSFTIGLRRYNIIKTPKFGKDKECTFIHLMYEIMYSTELVF